MKYTVKQDVLYEEKVESSRFIVNLFSIDNEKAVKTRIKEINKLYNNATHNCPAYCLGYNAALTFSSDGGEPSGTAGKPILNMLNRYELTNVLCIITRYFGGVKLGIRGLINAYSQLTENAIKTADLIEVKKYVHYMCKMMYDFYNIFCSKISNIAEIVATKYGEQVIINVRTEEKFNDILLDTFCSLKDNNKHFIFEKILNEKALFR
jgi:uncharacterized YigZ family protein